MVAETCLLASLRKKKREQASVCTCAWTREWKGCKAGGPGAPPAHWPERHRLKLLCVNQNGLGGALPKTSVTGAAFQLGRGPRRDAALFVADEVRVSARMR